jgi:hypothetical protein
VFPAPSLTADQPPKQAAPPPLVKRDGRSIGEVDEDLAVCWGRRALLCGPSCVQTLQGQRHGNSPPRAALGHAPAGARPYPRTRLAVGRRPRLAAGVFGDGAVLEAPQERLAVGGADCGAGRHAGRRVALKGGRSGCVLGAARTTHPPRNPQRPGSARSNHRQSRPTHAPPPTKQLSVHAQVYQQVGPVAGELQPKVLAAPADLGRAARGVRRGRGVRDPGTGHATAFSLALCLPSTGTSPQGTPPRTAVRPGRPPTLSTVRPSSAALRAAGAQPSITSALGRDGQGGERLRDLACGSTWPQRH